MTVGKIRTLTSAGLLLVSIQISLAADQRQEFQNSVGSLGPAGGARNSGPANRRPRSPSEGIDRLLSVCG